MLAVCQKLQETAGRDLALVKDSQLGSLALLDLMLMGIQATASISKQHQARTRQLDRPQREEGHACSRVPSSVPWAELRYARVDC